MIADVTVRTTAEQRRTLAVYGFVHVTGLKAKCPLGDSYIIIGQDLPARWVGHYDSNNGVSVVVTTGGEVWIAYGCAPNQSVAEFRTLVQELCPNGRGAFVPCSNGEQLSMHDILSRLTNPDWEPR